MNIRTHDTVAEETRESLRGGYRVVVWCATCGVTNCAFVKKTLGNYSQLL
jgi:hypothetical protein